MRQEVLADVSETLSELLEDLTRRDIDDGRIAFVGRISILDHDLTVRVAIDKLFPLSLPEFFLEPWDAAGFIPHVSPRGMICYLSPEGTVLDGEQPGRIVREALHLAVEVLTSGIQGVNKWEFVDEYEAYWQYLQPSHDVRLISFPGDKLSTLDMKIDDKGKVWLARNAESFHRYSPHTTISESTTFNAGIYLPLKAATYLEPPRSDAVFWTAREIRGRLLPHLSEETRRRLRSSISRSSGPDFYLVACLPRPAGGESLFGIKYSGLGSIHPLRDGGTAASITPFIVDRLDSKFLLKRGGASSSLGDIKVIVVGCGSLGSRIATELARSGISTLTLVDPDILEAGNTFRHPLGRPYWGFGKVGALKFALEWELPFLKVKAVAERIERVLTGHSVDFATYDLVVFATGNPTIELAMNEVISRLPHPPLTVFSWLEPLGIGGHALQVRYGAGGCFRCLYCNPDEEQEGLYNKASFAQKKQSFGRALSGCGSLFTPFGSNDAATTASMAVRLALDGLLGQETGSPLLSWRGDAAQFLSEGFLLSQRYGVSEQDLFDYRYAYKSECCPVCGHRRAKRE